MSSDSKLPPPNAPQPDVPPSPADSLSTNNRLLQYVGMGLIVLAFPLTWWSLTKYRVYEQRGVDLGSAEQMNAITKDMDDDDRKDYEERLGSYGRAWGVNLGRFEHDFYYPHLGEDYAKRLNDEMAYSMRSGTLGLRGWSTWTGWFGVAFVVLLIGSQIVPRLSEDFEPIAWAFPWAGAIVFGFYTLMTLVFYFSVPDSNGDGYSQGVGLGNYLALFGAVLVTTGTVFEGIKTANDRLAAIEAAGDDEEDDDEPKDVKRPAASKPPEPKKNRLQDW